MIKQQAPVASADAQQLLIDNKVNIFLFDLKNEAVEHGFKEGDLWDVQLTSDIEMKHLKRAHNLVVSMRLQPQVLLKAYQRVKSGLKQTLSSTDAELTELGITNSEKQYLTAVPVRHVRK